MEFFDRMIDGVITAMITPFSQDGQSVDYDAMKNLIVNQHKAGIRCLLIGGSTGEPHCLDDTERKALIRFSVKNCHDLKLKCIIGTGTNCTRQSIELTKMAQSEGADAVMLTCPYYNKPSQRMIVNHFTQICQSCPDLPVLLYNVPSRTGVDILAPAAIECANKISNVIGYKEATADVEKYKILRDGFPSRVALYSGEDLCLVDGIKKSGCHGIVSVASNVVPNQMVQIHKLCVDGKFADAQNKLNLLAPLINTLFSESSPVPVKYVSSKLFRHSPMVRSPLMPASSDTINMLDTILIDLER
eukprot:GHVH01001094.1.p1 GENE.GHVH01001094.1~~GHVH01001094.1.p1  ORF type:complete len:302 (+),score=33.01 GHVH01001094.1:114-1019(+)